MSEQLEQPQQQQGPIYRVPRRSGMDVGTRRLALIAGGLGGVLLLVVGVASFSGRHGGTVPVVEANGGPVRVKPENPGGMQVAGANDEILSGDANPKADKLLPPPETPAPQALKAAEAKPPAAPPAPSAASPSPSPVPAPVAQAPAVPAAGDHKVAVAPPAAKSSTPPAGGKATQVQLAAMDSEQLARDEWQRLNKRMPDVMSGRQPAVVRAERDGKTIYRLRTGGFTDIAQATAFCEKVRSKGAGCSIASF